MYMCMYLYVYPCSYVLRCTLIDAEMYICIFWGGCMDGWQDLWIYGSMGLLVTAHGGLGHRSAPFLESPSRFHHHVISCLPIPSMWLVFVQNKLDMIVAARRCWTCPHSSCNEHRKEKALKWSPPRKRTRDQKQFLGSFVKKTQIKRHLSYQTKIYSKHAVTEQLQFRILACVLHKF